MDAKRNATRFSLNCNSFKLSFKCASDIYILMVIPEEHGTTLDKIQHNMLGSLVGQGRYGCAGENGPNCLQSKKTLSKRKKLAAGAISLPYSCHPEKRTKKGKGWGGCFYPD